LYSSVSPFYFCLCISSFCVCLQSFILFFSLCLSLFVYLSVCIFVSLSPLGHFLFSRLNGFVVSKTELGKLNLLYCLAHKKNDLQANVGSQKRVKFVENLQVGHFNTKTYLLMSLGNQNYSKLQIAYKFKHNSSVINF